MKKATAQPSGKPKPFVVTASLDAVLQAVYRYHLLTSVQLLKACGYSRNSLGRVQRLTKQLVDNEYLLSLARPVVRGKAPLVYTLARKGLCAMSRITVSLAEPRGTRRKVPGSSNLPCVERQGGK